jgi:branched-chain amino acid transport system substrate-binding protein
MKKVIVLLALVVPVLLLMLLNVPCNAEGVIKIGSFNPLTGPAATWGDWTDKAVDLGFDQWNAKGGVTVNGQKYKFEMIHYDDKLTGEEALKAANKLIFTDKVSFIVGPLVGASVLAAQTITEPNKILMLMGAFLGPEGLRNKPYTFRVTVPPAHSGPAFWGFVKKRHPELKTYVHIAPNNLDGRGAAQGDNDACFALGFKYLGNEFFEAGTQDFTPMLARALRKNPDFLSLCGANGADCALIIKQARELGYKGRFLHSGGFVPSQVGPIAGWQNIEGVITSSVGYDGPACPEAVKVAAAKWKEKYGTYEGWSIGGFLYLYADVLAPAIEKANSLESEKVKTALENMDIKTISGVAKWGGMKTYGDNHQLLVPHIISEIQNKKLAVVGIEMPWDVPPPEHKWD